VINFITEKMLFVVRHVGTTDLWYLAQGKLSSNISTTLVYYSLGFPLKATYKKAMARQTQNTKFRRNVLTRWRARYKNNIIKTKTNL